MDGCRRILTRPLPPNAGRAAVMSLVRRVTPGMDDLQAEGVLERIEVTIAVQQ
jgi:hypothetical protein